MSVPYLKGNESENGPHYYCFEDNEAALYWMIPLSSRIDKYQKIIENKENVEKHLTSFILLN